MERNTLTDETLENLDENFESDVSEDADELDNDFEYDEGGNIVIPDDDADTGDEEAKADDTNNGEDSEKPDDAKADDTDAKDEETEKLKSELTSIKAQARETLKKLGVKIENDDDVLMGLVKLAAESEDTTPEEYLKQKAEDEKLEAAKRLIAQQEGEAIRRADLDELHQFFPETAEYDDVTKLPNFKRFGELRMIGLSAKEAYSASHTNAIRETAVASAKRQSLNDTKNHLRTTVPKGAKDDAITMSKKDLAEMREQFPDLNDKEIEALYKRVSQK